MEPKKFLYGAQIKKIHNHILTLLRDRSISVSSHKKMENSSDAIVTYFNSTLARGVESNRRIQILVGKADKPQGSYESLVYGNMDAFRVPAQILLDYATEQNLTVDEYNNMLDHYIKYNRYISKINHFKIHKEPINQDIDPKLKPIFQKISNEVQQEIVFQDSWQAASRAKDPSGKNPSLIYCLGWKEQDVNDLITWCSNLPYYQETRKILKPPKVINYNPDAMRRWMDGKNVDDEINVKTDFLTNLLHLILRNLKLTSKQLSYFIGATDHKNGYIVGSTRLLMKANYTLTFDEIAPGEFNYGLGGNDEFNQIPHLELILQILRVAYEIQKDRINYNDLRHKIKVVNVEQEKNLKYALKAIDDYNLLDKSTWHIEQGRAGNPVIIKDVKTV